MARNIRTYFKTNLKNAKTNLKKTQKRPTELRVYKLRVAIRRLKTVLDILDDNGIETLSKKHEKNLTRIWKALGKERDLDVAIKNAKRYHINPRVLLQKRVKAKRKLVKILGEKDLSKTFYALKSIDKHMAKKELVLIKTIAKFQLELEQNFKTLAEVHYFRILFKQIRYALDSVGIKIEAFKPMQNVLGHLNDLDCLNELLDGHPKVKKMRDLQYKKAIKKLPAAKKLAHRKLKEYQV